MNYIHAVKVGIVKFKLLVDDVVWLMNIRWDDMRYLVQEVQTYELVFEFLKNILHA